MIHTKKYLQLKMNLTIFSLSSLLPVRKYLQNHEEIQVDVLTVVHQESEKTSRNPRYLVAKKVR
jgi:hypothetical protein